MLLALAACRTPAATPPAPTPIDAGADPTDAAPADPATAAVTEAECVRFVEHTLAIGMAQQRATKPADYVPTDEQVGAIRAKLIASRPCDGMTRGLWRCALAATTQDALYRCAQPQ